MYFQEKKNMKLRAVQNDIIFMLQKQEKGIITLSDNDNSLLLQRRLAVRDECSFCASL